MPKKADLQYLRAKGLLPFQAKFALSFLESEDETYWQLASPTGMGKTHIGAALIAHELEEGPDKRILVLAPAALLIQWQEEISTFLSATEPSCKPVIVDRRTYLELESKVTVNESPWPLPSIIVMSIDLAKRDDMASNLSRVTWDLIIFDESHLLSGGKRKALFNRLRESRAARRGLLLSATPTFVDSVVTKVTTWDWDVRDWDGQPLFPPFERKLTPVYYQRTNEERDFLNQLQDFTGSLTNSFPYGKLLEISILRAASSSSYAIEAMLQGLLNGWSHMRNKISHNVPWTGEDLENVQRRFSLAADESGVVEEVPEKITIRPQEFLTLYQKLESLLDRIDEIPTDSKLDTLISHTRKFFDLNKKLHLCIWCTFAKTVHYVSSSLQDLEKPVFSFTGALELAKRMYRLEAFRKDGGILIVTDAASEGVALEYVDECINYDLPTNMNMLEQRWGRFLRIGRKSDLRMVVLRDKSKALQWEEDTLKVLEGTASSKERRS